MRDNRADAERGQMPGVRARSRGLRRRRDDRNQPSEQSWPADPSRVDGAGRPAGGAAGAAITTVMKTKLLMVALTVLLLAAAPAGALTRRHTAAGTALARSVLLR